MARYTGPRVRISRRFGVPVFGPSKYLERCYLGEHNVEISNRAEATAYVNECRLNKRNGDVVKLTASDNNITDIQLKVRGVDFGQIHKLSSGNQFGFAISTQDIGDGELVECATAIGGFTKSLKY